MMPLGHHLADGVVAHARHWPVAHAFHYRTGWLLLDTARLPQLLDRGWWSRFRRPAWMRFHRGDFLAGAGDLDTAVRDLVQARSGSRPTGAIQVLTTLRCAGAAFNPVSFYFCRDPAGAVETVVAEITNTPWGERHAYVLGREQNSGSATDHAYTFAKTFHVSPFNPMEQRYRWRFRFAPRRLSVCMDNDQRIDGAWRPVFRATLALALVPATPARLLRHTLAWPLTALRALAAIYRQALSLWWHRAPFHPHPAP